MNRWDEYYWRAKMNALDVAALPWDWLPIVVIVVGIAVILIISNGGKK